MTAMGGFADHELGEEPETGVSPEEKLKEPDMHNRKGKQTQLFRLSAGQQAVPLLRFQVVERK
jgi:hypothetical protein